MVTLNQPFTGVFSEGEASAFGLVGAPSSAAGHWPGMEKAPAFLRGAGLIERIREAGIPLVDHGDLPQIRWRPDPDRPQTQNLSLVGDYLAEVARRVREVVGERQLPLVIGGECTVTIGVVAGLLSHHRGLGLVYLDGHVDLNTPASTASGVLDSMVMTHLLARPDSTAELRDLGPRSPMLEPDQVLCFGYNEREMNPVEIDELPRIGMTTYPLSRVRSDVPAMAAEALATLEDRVEEYVVHLDVDVISFTDFPIANVPTHHSGLTFAQAMTCLEVFTSSRRCAGVVVTEINPDHATEAHGHQFAAGLARALSGRLQRTSANDGDNSWF